MHETVNGSIISNRTHFSYYSVDVPGLKCMRRFDFCLTDHMLKYLSIFYKRNCLKDGCVKET